LGQTFSTRTDILPLEITSELEKLQDNVTPIDKNYIINTLSQELTTGNNLDNNMLLFESFDYSPYKSASL
jgi:predicted unusual protein kinase regulating ubiquinone biosynthesis (AarF/ABC1/UbiB family)